LSKVLITGAGGFIGSHLVERCVELGFQVRAFIKYNSMNRWGWLEKSRYLNEIEIICGDIRDYDSVHGAMKDCDSVFHLAALIGIPYSYLSPIAYIKTNLEGTYNVLQAARENNLTNILITSTSETYGSAQYVPIDEKHPLVGQSPYAASKISADQLAISYFRSYEMPIKIVRPFNTYGPRQSARAIIPTIISQVMADSKIIKVGNINVTRDLTFVADTVEGFIELFKSTNLYGEVANIGMGDEISIENLGKLILKLMDKDIDFVVEQERVRPDNSEVERLVCNNSKIKKFTRWIPKYNLEKGLLETIEFIARNLNLYKYDLYNV